MSPVKGAPADLADLKARTFVELLERQAARHGDDIALHLLSDGDPRRVRDITYRALVEGARAKAAALQERGLCKGDRVVLVLPTGVDFLDCFFGTVFAGGVPVPAYPPLGLGRIEEYLERLASIVNDSGATMLCTTRSVVSVIGQVLPRMVTLSEVIVAKQVQGGAERFVPVAIDTEDTALLQYTSGSTGAQKGVELSHLNILANIHGIGLGLGCREGIDVGCSWLPLCHDMGLIGSLLVALYWRVRVVLMSPQAFIGDPKRWLWAIHNYKVTISPAPNFAYDICARRIPDADVEGLDLSSWRIALNGAEPVSFASIDAFVERFERHGFRRDSPFPVYGLAENSLAATFPEARAEILVDVVDSQAFEERGLAVVVNGGIAKRMVSVGRPLWGVEIRVVDPAGRDLPERAVGELLLHGPSVMKGYFGNPEATTEVLAGGWLHTGDLAYVADGRVFIAGRIKDLIIKRGRNYYPQDLERAVERIPGVRTGCTVAFGIPNEREGTEDVILLAETRLTDPAEREKLMHEIRHVLPSTTGIQVDLVQLLAPHTLPKTTSGKIQRRQARALFLTGELQDQQSLGFWLAVRTFSLSILGLARFERRRREARTAQ